MNSHDILIPITDKEKIKQGIDYDKSILFVKAARAGNLDEVKKMAKDPQVDINAMALAKMQEIGYIVSEERHCALSMAIAYENTDVVLFLIQQGATVEITDPKYWFYDSKYKTALALTLEFPCDFSVFKALLRATNHLDLPVNNMSLANALINNRGMESKTIYISLFFHEVVLRNRREMIDEMRSLDKRIYIDRNSLQEYLKGLILTAEQKATACDGLDYLAECGLLTREACEGLQELVDAKHKTKHSKSADISRLKEENMRLRKELAEVKAERDALQQHKEVETKSVRPGLFGTSK